MRIIIMPCGGGFAGHTLAMFLHIYHTLPCISLYHIIIAGQDTYQWNCRSTHKSTLSCWVQNEVDKVVWCFGSSEVHFLPQSYRFLIFSLPLHSQLTLWYPPTFFKLVYILLGDLVRGSITTYLQYWITMIIIIHTTVLHI